MPRRTQKGISKLKQQLQFVHAPLDGATHSYGPKARSARNPKIFLSDEQRQSCASVSWVMPQFDSTVVSRTLHPRRSRGITGCSSRNVPDSSSLLCLPRHRKASVCKFPTLTFQKRSAAPSRPPVTRQGESAKLGWVGEDSCTTEPVDRRPSPNSDTETRLSRPYVEKGTLEDSAVHQSTPDTAASCAERCKGPGCIIKTPVGHKQPSFTDSGFTPPDIETPVALQASRTCSLTQETRLDKHHLLFPQTPRQAPPPPVLVSDTPEEHYGKNWRWSQLSFLLD